MKRIALLVFALATVVVADEDAIKHIAEIYESDVETVQACLEEGETNTDEIKNVMKSWKEIESDNMEEETKHALTRYNLFLTCMLEKEGMMQDSKLVVDKVLETIEKNAKKDFNRDDMKECITAINENDDMKREEKSLGLMLCITKSTDFEEEKE